MSAATLLDPNPVVSPSGMTGLTHLKTFARTVGGVDVGLEMALVFYDEDRLSKDDFLGEVKVPIPASGTLRELPLTTSAKFSDFVIPSPLVCIGSDLYYNIHATSLTTSAFP